MIIEKCTSEESCAWLLEFLERIPNFNLHLTNQEKRLITTPGNVLCIGRSGTGKVIFKSYPYQLADNLSSIASVCLGDLVQDPLVPLLQRFDLLACGWLQRRRCSGLDDEPALGDRDSEPRPHERDPPLLHPAQGESGGRAAQARTCQKIQKQRSSRSRLINRRIKGRY
jgi:hypothetical protein